MARISSPCPYGHYVGRLLFINGVITLASTSQLLKTKFQKWSEKILGSLYRQFLVWYMENFGGGWWEWLLKWLSDLYKCVLREVWEVCGQVVRRWRESVRAGERRGLIRKVSIKKKVTFQLACVKKRNLKSEKNSYVLWRTSSLPTPLFSRYSLDFQQVSICLVSLLV